MLTFLKKIVARKIYKSIYKPGHYYSPIPDLKEIAQDAHKIFSVTLDEKAIDLNLEGQKNLLKKIQPFIQEVTFSADKQQSRYYSNNGYFVESDALYYQAILKEFRPKKVIEVGSGFSSALLFDTLERFQLPGISIDFIEPFPDRLLGLVKKGDEKYFTLHQQKVQHVPVGLFLKLERGDILFIDSSHISKTGSDVNFLIFQILPLLKPGVLVHFHDILFPFEYPKEWVLEGRFWNEAYLLKAFLMYNRDFKILLFNDHLLRADHDFTKSIDARLQAGGGSIWLQKN